LSVTFENQCNLYGGYGALIVLTASKQDLLSQDKVRDLIDFITVYPGILCLPLIQLKIVLVLLLLTALDLGHTTMAQQLAFSQVPIENTSNEIKYRLDTIIELLERSRQGSIIQLYLTIIVFMMGLAFVIFGLYIGQEHKLSVFTKRLYLIAYFALIIPITVILIRYIANTLLAGALEDPVLTVAFLLLIPVTASYVLMIVKTKHDIVMRS
jgi:hypothetical protein